MLLKERLNSLSSIVPSEIIELLKAYDYALNAREYFSTQYDKAYGNKEEHCMNPYFVADKNAEHIEAISDKLWSRATNELHDWLCGDND